MKDRINRIREKIEREQERLTNLHLKKRYLLYPHQVGAIRECEQKIDHCLGRIKMLKMAYGIER